MAIRNIVVMMPKYLGDCVMATPALQLLAQLHPKARITLVCRRSTAQLFERSNYLTILDPREQHKAKGVVQLAVRLKKARYDLAILFSNSFVSALIFKLAGIRPLVGYASEGRGPLLDVSETHDRNRHYINRYARLVKLYTRSNLAALPPVSLTHGTDAPMLASTRGNRIGVYFGGRSKGHRHYPKHLAVQVLDSITRHGNTTVVLLGDHQECRDNDLLACHIHSRQQQCLDLTGKTTVSELVDVIAGLDLLLTIDSSPLHIAAAVNTPYVCLVGFGTSPWSQVKPKVDFGYHLESPGQMLDEARHIEEICPQYVANIARQALMTGKQGLN